MGLRTIKYREFIVKLKRFGLSGPFSGGKHPYFLLKNGGWLIIPNFHGKDVSAGILKQVVEYIGITEKEFIEL